jgi:hypothetical protein
MPTGLRMEDNSESGKTHTAAAIETVADCS